MQRKLIKQGLGGLTFYVPKKWTDERGLLAGDEIDISEREDKLVLSSVKGAKNKKKSEIEISIENESDEFIRNYMNQLYRLGYDKIIVNSSKKDRLLRCQQVTSLFLLGFEVTDMSKTQCVIENISEPSMEKDDSVFRREFLLIEESFEMLINNLTEGKLANKKEIDRNTKKVTQYDNFCRRNLVKQNLAFGRQFFQWEVYSLILMIQHNLFHIYYNCPEKIVIDRHSIEYLKLIKDNFSAIHTAFYKKDLNSLDSLQAEANKMFDKMQKESKSFSKSDARLFYYLCESARLQYLLCSPMISHIHANS